MPDSYARPNSGFWKEWQIVILATKYTLSRYREHCISFTVNEEIANGSQTSGEVQS